MSKKKKKLNPATKAALGKVAKMGLNAATSFIPGGALVKSGIGMLGKMFNHPEWWEVEPISAPPQNVPLIGQSILGSAGGITRPYWLHVTSSYPHTGTEGAFCMALSTDYISKYIMRDVRRIVVGIPLQNVESYQDAMLASTAIVALYHTLEKYKYMMENPHPQFGAYTSDFSMFKSVDFARVEALCHRARLTIGSLIMLPTTLTEYLAWRYRRVYKATTGGKAPMVTYDYFSPSASIASVENEYDRLIVILANNAEAMADLNKTYQGHVQVMDIPEDTQYVFDYKEHSLRLNLRPSTPGASQDWQASFELLSPEEQLARKGLVEQSTDVSALAPELAGGEQAFACVFGPLEPDTVALSSTTSLATRVTTYAQGPDAAGHPLFPIDGVTIYTYGAQARLCLGVGQVPTAVYGQTDRWDIPLNAYIGSAMGKRGLHRISLLTGVGMANYTTIYENPNPALATSAFQPVMEGYEIAKVARSTLEQFKDYQVANLTALSRKQSTHKDTMREDVKALESAASEYVEAATGT